MTGYHRHRLEAAGGAPDPNYPSDGMSIVPALTIFGSAHALLALQSQPPTRRRDGDWKILKMLDNTSCLTRRPLERANLKDRHRDIYDRMVEEWNAWNNHAGGGSG
jgi:hypothetical protein